MASAKKCDRCGKLYEYYSRKIDGHRLNGMAFTVDDDTFGLRRVQDFDLCGDCFTELIEWVKSGEKNGM